MEINDILNLLKEIPVWGWIVFAIVFFMIFGDRKRWEYEFNIAFIDGFGHGEIEFECAGNKLLKRERKRLEIELSLEPPALNKAYDIFLNGNLVYQLSSSDTASPNVRINKQYPGPEPSQGDRVEIRGDNNVIVSGKLHKD